jgi:pyridoxamine 5'-phosphate oxidase
MNDDPIARFNAALARASDREPDVPNAMALATVDDAGRPSVRMVLLKEAAPSGFTFFTNYDSRKGRELADNPHAALCFHWKTLGEQVRVEGAVTRVSAAESDAYFASRPQQSQLAAIASAQSQPLATRELLDARYAALAAQYGDAKPPRPAFWGGYRLSPESIEFWYHRDHRLHERTLYTRIDGALKDGAWKVSALQP